MKSIIILIGLIGLTLSAPVDKKDTPTLLKYENINDGSGSYSFAYETSDGTSRREEGAVKHRDNPEEGFVIIIGSFSYVGSNGVTYTVNYVADENGFQPYGSHLPGNPASKTLSDPRFNDRKLI